MRPIDIDNKKKKTLIIIELHTHYQILFWSKANNFHVKLTILYTPTQPCEIFDYTFIQYFINKFRKKDILFFLFFRKFLSLPDTPRAIRIFQQFTENPIEKINKHKKKTQLWRLSDDLGFRRELILDGALNDLLGILTQASIFFMFLQDIYFSFDI